MHKIFNTKKISEILILLLSIPKSLIFNLKYFPFLTALKLPIIVSYNTKLVQVEGIIVLPPEWRTGIVRIGFGNVSIFDRARSRTIWKNRGSVVFTGSCRLGHGSKVIVDTKGELSFGNNFILSAESQIVCRKRIKFGDNCLLSWEILIIDSDYHKIFSLAGELLNPDKDIIIGNNVWIGARSMIKKGISVADHTVIAAQTVVTTNINHSYQVWGGNPGKLVKEGVVWKD